MAQRDDVADAEVVEPGVADDMALAPVQQPFLAAIAQSEVLAQLDAAHRYPRSVSRFLREAMTLATMNKEIAAACMYTVPRGGKQITGPSIRLAEICATAYGNLQVGARVVDEGADFITAQGVAWDVEKNLRATIEVRRRITGRDGKRYNADGIQNAGASACSIARRSVIYQIVPRAYVDEVYLKAREVAVGKQNTLDVTRTALLKRLGILGVTLERVLAKVGKVGVDDIGLEEVEILIGLGTSIHDGVVTIDDAFPPVRAVDDQPAEGVRISLTKDKRTAKTTETPAPPPEAPPGAPAREAGEPDALDAEIKRLEAAIDGIKNSPHWKNWKGAHGSEIDAIKPVDPEAAKALWARYDARPMQGFKG